MPWAGRPEYTIMWPSSVVKCPCPSHLTSDNPHISKSIHPNLIISSPSSWTFPNCSILRIFHVPSLSLLHHGWTSNRFLTVSWLFDRECEPCLFSRVRRPSQNICACIVHCVVREDKMVGSQVFPSRSRQTLFQLHLHQTCLFVVASQLLPHEVVLRPARERRPAAAQVSVDNSRILRSWDFEHKHSNMFGSKPHKRFYRDTTSESWLSVQSCSTTAGCESVY